MVAHIRMRIIKNDLQRLIDATPQSADRALRAVAQHGETHAKLIMTDSPASGRQYRRGSVTHTASSPGNAPRVDTGNLRASIRHVKRRNLIYAVVAGGNVTGSDVGYAVHLEFGTTKMRPRPFMGPTAREMESVISEMFDQFLEKE